ncbi:LADA_0C03466g1_1 [Lachancea dasiensis]|uniref:LADA_0C03466g1_1 n=1 Tax=Lachancea dasiensis TaxID=1072105 RepID=A0A1G4IYY4_9SACH|nr:LADA_0C03466g1_1 [Lachancea dasiensis]
MASLSTFLYVYLFGGITFPIAVLYLLFVVAPEAESQRKPTPRLLVPDIEPDFKAGEIEEKKGVDVLKKGWLTVTTKYYYHSSELLQTADLDEINVRTRDKLKRKHVFYAVLKHGNLFLYKDDSIEASVSHVIVLKNSFVSIWPRAPAREAPEGSLFTKKTCISIFKNGTAAIDSEGNLSLATQAANSKHLDHFFLYVTNNVEKEDWYFALINASKVPVSKGESSVVNDVLNPNISAQTAHFATRDMLQLIQALNSSEGQLSTKWLNALTGRLFLALQQTETLSEYLRQRISRKLTKLNKPGFLDDFVIDRVDAGNAAPIITHPCLKEINTEGLMKIGLQFSYEGALSMIISTKANINLGSRFKTREVTLQLAITVKKVVGPILVLIKPPPSNRVWYSFETEPFIDMDVEPVVSTKQLSYNMVTNAIKSKFREAIKESIVMPFMDDIPFNTSITEMYRGGIWEHKKAASNGNKEGGSAELDFHQSKEKDFSRSNVRETDVSKLDYEMSEAQSDHSMESGLDVRMLQVGKDDDSDHQSIRQKTLQKVGTIKSILNPKSESITFKDELDEWDESEKMRRSSTESQSFVDKDEKGPKNYINTGIKKFGKWYKDSLSTPGVNPDQPIDDSSEQSLKMISNRRKLPKMREREVLKSPELGDRSSSDAAEMFAKNKPRSTSVNSQGTPVNTSFTFSTTSPQSPNTPGWANQEVGTKGQPDGLERQLVLEGSKMKDDEKVGFSPAALSTTEITSKLDEHGQPERLLDDQVREASTFHVSLQELNKRRPVPPLPAPLVKPDDTTVQGPA